MSIKREYSLLAVPDPAVPGFVFTPAAPVTVEVVNSDGACRGATFEGGAIRTNEADTFKATVK